MTKSLLELFTRNRQPLDERALFSVELSLSLSLSLSLLPVFRGGAPDARLNPHMKDVIKMGSGNRYLWSPYSDNAGTKILMKFLGTYQIQNRGMDVQIWFVIN